MNDFSAGPRLSDSPAGDPRRQAVASLRGYAYQLYASALAWLSLKAGQSLFLEVAEDYAVVADQALKGVQVKDTAASGSITINNPDVLEALNSYVDLVQRNPDMRVSFRFLTTANLGRERDVSERIDGIGVLDYWRRAAAGSDVTPLRKALLAASITGPVRDFIEARDSAQLREDLLKPIHWDCHQESLEDISAQLEGSLIEFASERLQLSLADCNGLSQVVLGEVLTAIVRPGSLRKLALVDLLRVCEEHGKTSISNSVLARLTLAANLPNGRSQGLLDAAAFLEATEGFAFPSNLSPRKVLVDAALRYLHQDQLVLLVGSTGLGKTLVARLVALDHGGQWLVLDLRDVPAAESCRRLDAALAQIARSNFAGVIIDDANELESPGVAHRVARFVRAVRRQDGVCVLTCYRNPSNAVADRFGLSPLPVLAVERLTLEEVVELVRAAGGPPERVGQLTYWLSRRGHPQLVQALISNARRRGWTTMEQAGAEVVETLQEDLRFEQRQLQRVLVDQFDAATRTLLYRMSLLHGRFDRSLAMQMADVDPPIALAGEGLEQLVGPWIEDLGAGQLRVSPLVDRAGEEKLSAREQVAVHHRAAMVVGEGNAFGIDRVDALYKHALKGYANSILIKIALAVMAAGVQHAGELVYWMPALSGEPLDRPIYPSDLHTSKYLRFAQVLLLAETDEPARRLGAWTALRNEIGSSSEGGEPFMFEYLVLSKALISMGLARIFSDPVNLLERHHDLTSSSGRLMSLMSGFEDKSLQGGRSVVTSSIFFATQALGVGTIERQRQLFLALGRLGAEAREKYLKSPNDSQEGMQAMVNAGWLAEVKAGTLAWSRAAETFLEVAELAAAWGHRDLALYFHVARCVMLDEYGQQPEQAAIALDDAEALLGSDVILSRGRAKLHFRSGRFSDSLNLAEGSVTDLAKLDALERAFLCREAAISAANLDDWPKCREWLGVALQTSGSLLSERLRPMYIGLKADFAIAAYQAGDHQQAIQVFAEVLTLVKAIEDDTSTRAIYCHRVVHHVLLWMYSQTSGKRPGLEVHGAPPVMQAGMCSNPEPSEAIRDQPKGSPITAWHLLSTVESRYLGCKAARIALDSRLNGLAYPSLEFMTRPRFLEHSIIRLNVEEFVESISPWIDVCAYLYLRNEEMMANSPANPTAVDMPVASESEWQDERLAKHVRDAVLAFCIQAAMLGRESALVDLQAALSESRASGVANSLLSQILLGEEALPDESRDKDICSTIRLVLQGEHLSHEQLFAVTLRLLETVYESTFRHGLKDSLVAWGTRRWRTAINVRFGFKAPNVYIRAINDALQLEGLGRLSAVLLAAEPALNLRITDGLRQWLAKVS